METMEREGCLRRCPRCGLVLSVDELEPGLNCPFCHPVTARPPASWHRPTSYGTRRPTLEAVTS